MGELPPNLAQYQAYQDNEHLRLLSIFHYVLGALNGFIGLFGLVYVFVGTAIASSPLRSDTPDKVPFTPAFVGSLFAIFGGVFVVVSWLIAGLTIYAGICIVKRQKPVLIYIVSAVNCLQIPWGTALGVITLLVMSRPSVKSQFDRPKELLREKADAS